MIKKELSLKLSIIHRLPPVVLLLIGCMFAFGYFFITKSYLSLVYCILAFLLAILLGYQYYFWIHKHPYITLTNDFIKVNASLFYKWTLDWKEVKKVEIKRGKIMILDKNMKKRHIQPMSLEKKDWDFLVKTLENLPAE